MKSSSAGGRIRLPTWVVRRRMRAERNGSLGSNYCARAYRPWRLAKIITALTPKSAAAGVLRVVLVGHAGGDGASLAVGDRRQLRLRFLRVAGQLRDRRAPARGLARQRVFVVLHKPS